MDRSYGTSLPVTPGGRVLIIDDELPLLRSYERILKRLFDVVLVADPRDALELLESDQDFDVIVCDLTMPHINGAGVYTALSEIAPQLLERMIFCTGGAMTPELMEWLRTIDNVQLTKPVGLEALRTTIASVRDDNAVIG